MRNYLGAREEDLVDTDVPHEEAGRFGHFWGVGGRFLSGGEEEEDNDDDEEEDEDGDSDESMPDDYEEDDEFEEGDALDDLELFGHR